MKQLRQKLEQESDPSEADKIRHDLHIAEVDEAYTLYFPHLETYVGLYSSNAKKTAEEETEEGKTAAAKAALEAERPPMWSVIEKALAEGTPALETLRDRRSPGDDGEIDDTQPPIRPRATPKAPLNTPAPRHNGASRKNQEEQQRSAKAPEPSSNHGDQEQHPELNRRERRKLMREALAAATNDEDDENGDGGFFEGL